MIETNYEKTTPKHDQEPIPSFHANTPKTKVHQNDSYIFLA